MNRFSCWRAPSRVALIIASITLVSSAATAHAESECSPEDPADVIRLYPSFLRDAAAEVPSDFVPLVYIGGRCEGPPPSPDELTVELVAESGAASPLTLRAVDASDLSAGGAGGVYELIGEETVAPGSYTLRWTGPVLDLDGSFRVGSAPSTTPVAPQVEVTRIDAIDNGWAVLVESRVPTDAEGTLFLQLQSESGEVTEVVQALTESRDGISVTYGSVPPEGDGCVTAVLRAPNGVLSEPSAPSCFDSPGCSIGRGRSSNGALLGVTVALALGALRRRRARTRSAQTG